MTHHHKLRSLHPDLITINTAVSACAKGEWAMDAKRLIQEMEDRWGLTPSLVTYNSLVDALAHTGRWKEAIEVRGGGGRLCKYVGEAV